MRIARSPHPWSVTPRQARRIQETLRHAVIRDGVIHRLRLAAGADIAFSPDQAQCIAAVVVWDIAAGRVCEQHVVRRPVRFPYVPGLLSFREAPAILAALRKLRCTPDVFLFDGHGYAHPRRFGLACHLGVILDRPALGCAKSLLIGAGPEPLPHRGATAPLAHHGEHIGAALRTRAAVKPVYVSVGHRLCLEAALEVTLACGTRYRLPEPTRLADQLVSRERSLA